MSEFKARLDLGALAAAEGFVIKGADPLSQTGYAVAGGGDIDDDGYDDLVIGAPGGGITGRGNGAAFGVFGDKNPSGTVDLGDMATSTGFRIDGTYRASRFGASVAIIGDFNARVDRDGDDYDDIAIGAPSADFFEENGGIVSVVYGHSPAGRWKTTFGILGDREGDRAGTSVAGAGDIDFDGYDDLLIGAPIIGSDGTVFDPFDYGRAYVFKGTGDPNQSGGYDLGRPFDYGYLFQSDGDQDDFGWSVAGLGDVNGDFVPDFVIGAPRSDAAGSNAGSSRVVLGGYRIANGAISWQVKDIFEISGGGLDQESGSAVSSAGDLNGDGMNEIVIGAPAFGRGVVYVIYGQTTPFASEVSLGQMNGVHGFRIAGGANGNLAGSSVSSAGDVNGDGYDDLLIGAPGAARGGANSGSAYVLFGKPGYYANLTLSALDGANGFAIDGAGAGDKAGYAVSKAGDVNGDGFDDLIVGAPGADVGVLNGGAAYVIYGHRADEAVLRLGTDLDQTINGGRGADTIDGFGGGDMLYGWEGDDTLQGGAGGDTLDGGAGKDQLRGGAGDDLYRITTGLFGTDVVDELPGQGIDTVEIAPGFVLPGKGKPRVGEYSMRDNVEDAQIVGTRKFNVNGNDQNNELDGNQNGNELEGRGGADTLYGGAGADLLTGGTGADVFRFRSVEESTIDAQDAIADFTTGLDRIDLRGIDARQGTPNTDDPFVFIGRASFTAEGQIRVTQSGDDAIIRLNTLGVTAAESMIVLRNVDADDIVTTDFFL